MTRRILIMLGLFLLSVSIVGIYAPNSDLGSFLTINQNFTVARMAIGTFLLFYGFFESFRLLPFRLILKLVGIMALGVGTLGIFFFYLLPIDIFIFQAVGIFALLGSFELPAATTLPMPLRWIFNPHLSFPKLSKNIQSALSHNGQPTASA
jgi:uncharacterized membrane protein YbaN (DUF454 family)